MQPKKVRSGCEQATQPYSTWEGEVGFPKALSNWQCCLTFWPCQILSLKTCFWTIYTYLSYLPPFHILYLIHTNPKVQPSEIKHTYTNYPTSLISYSIFQLQRKWKHYKKGISTTCIYHLLSLGIQEHMKNVEISIQLTTVLSSTEYCIFLISSHLLKH